MTLSNTTSRVSYTATGTNSIYTYTFRIYSASDLLVTTRNISNVETTLTLTTDYTVTGVGEATGGTVTLTAGNLTAGFVIVIRRVRPITQQEDFRDQFEFFPENHEDAYDKATMVDQQLQDELSRSVMLPETVSPTTFNPALPAASVAGAALVVNSAGNGFTYGSTSGVTDTTKVAKTGDTMTGNLVMAGQTGTTYEDATNSHGVTVKAVSALSASAVASIKDIVSNDNFVFENLAAPLSNKTLTTLVTPKGADYATTGSVNDLTTAGLSLLRYTGTGTATITGLANGSDGKYLTIVNAGTGALILNNADSGSLAANRILTGSATPTIVPVAGSISLIYDAGVTNWRVIGVRFPQSKPTQSASYTGDFGTTGSGSFVDASGLAVTLTTRGNAVDLRMDPVASASLVGQIIAPLTGSPTLQIAVKRGGTIISIQQLTVASSSFALPASIWSYTDAAAPSGSNTYQMSFSVSGNTKWTSANVVLTACEKP